MHRVLEEAHPLANPSESSTVNRLNADAPATADVYRDDPYRFEEEAGQDLMSLASTDDLSRIDYLPTPTEIAGVCAKIRRQWTRCEQRRRFVGELPAEAVDETLWAPPVIDTSHFRLASHGTGDVS